MDENQWTCGMWIRDDETGPQDLSRTWRTPVLAKASEEFDSDQERREGHQTHWRKWVWHLIHRSDGVTGVEWSRTSRKQVAIRVTAVTMFTAVMKNGFHFY